MAVADRRPRAAIDLIHGIDSYLLALTGGILLLPPLERIGVDVRVGIIDLTLVLRHQVVVRGERSVLGWGQLIHIVCIVTLEELTPDILKRLLALPAYSPHIELVLALGILGREPAKLIGRDIESIPVDRLEHTCELTVPAVLPIGLVSHDTAEVVHRMHARHDTLHGDATGQIALED